MRARKNARTGRRVTAVEIAEAAALAGVDAIELEACGWYGFEHGSAHDKTGTVAPAAAGPWLLSLCFCAGCRAIAMRPAALPPRASRRQPAQRR